MIELLQNRASFPARQLVDPAPDDAQLHDILRCGLSAPDHAAMRPWRFICIRGDARRELGDVFATVAKADKPDISDTKLDAIRDKPLRSPLIVVVVASIVKDHPKTPEIEQVLSAGAAATQIQLAATAAGFGAVWLTGPNAYHIDVKKALGIASDDHLIGFIYIGTPEGKQPIRKRPDLSEHLSSWEVPVA